jgi:hypothetical protein
MCSVSFAINGLTMKSLRIMASSRLPVILLALAWCGWYAPQAVRAGCGDYVTVHLPQPRPETHSLPDFSRPAAPPVHRPDGPASPCGGAMCAPDGDLPLAGASLPQVERIDQPALTDHHNGIHMPCSARIPLSQGPTALTGTPRSIFHPPRFPRLSHPCRSA